MKLIIWRLEINVSKSLWAPFMLFLLAACNGDKVPDCFQNAGDIMREEVSVPDFNTITAFENIELILEQGDTQRVEVETGAHLREEVSIEVRDGRLLLKDTNNCNLFREYGSTRIYVTSPNIEEIRSSTGFPIRSDGALSYDEITLYSESFVDPSSETTDGSFDLELVSQDIHIVVNGIAFLRLTGNTANLNITIAAGDSRIEADGLVAQTVTLDHRGTNDIFVNPQQALNGVIRGTGDVISFHRPALVDVEILYTGRLLFR